MHDPGLVGGFERGEDLEAERRDPLRGHRAVAVDDLLQRRGIDELHHDVDGVLVAAHVVDADGMAVLEPGGGAGLPQGARPGPFAFVLRDRLLEEDLLDGHHPVEQPVMRTPHDPAAALSQAVEQVVPVSDRARGHRARP